MAYETIVPTRRSLMVDHLNALRAAIAAHDYDGATKAFEDVSSAALYYEAALYDISDVPSEAIEPDMSHEQALTRLNKVIVTALRPVLWSMTGERAARHAVPLH